MKMVMREIQSTSTFTQYLRSELCCAFMTYMSLFSYMYVWRVRTIDVVEVQEYLQNKNKAPLAMDEVNSEITGLAQDRSFDVSKWNLKTLFSQPPAMSKRKQSKDENNDGDASGNDSDVVCPSTTQTKNDD